MEWILMMSLVTTREPEIIARGYETAEQCQMAANLIEAADSEARNVQRKYNVLCKETPKEAD